MTSIAQMLGDKADYLLNFKSPKIPKERLHLPGPDLVDRLFTVSDRNNRVLANLQRMVGHGRLGGTGYVSILPVDQGIEHSAASAFAPDPRYLDPKNIVVPNHYDQVMLGSVQHRACSPCCGATCATPRLGVTIEADIVKQKQPETNSGFRALDFDKTHPLLYGELTTEQRWRLGRPGRSRPGRADGGHQQEGRRHRPHHRPQGFPTAHPRRRRTPPRRPGRVPGRERHHRLTVRGHMPHAAPSPKGPGRVSASVDGRAA